ncbi:hypothetical protein [Rhodococcus sp. YH1]|uniref:hypothetical protein n=1 Tax=Rhodococcus sp. YH1 TaxID=89066 RepID=UPI0030845539
MAFSLDESVMGLAFPKEERAALVAGDPRKFQMPSASELRFNWVHADLASLEPTEARELVVDAWRMVVPHTPFRGSGPLSDSASRAFQRAGLGPCFRKETGIGPEASSGGSTV